MTDPFNNQDPYAAPAAAQSGGGGIKSSVAPAPTPAPAQKVAPAPAQKMAPAPTPAPAPTQNPTPAPAPDSSSTPAPAPTGLPLPNATPTPGKSYLQQNIDYAKAHPDTPWALDLANQIRAGKYDAQAQKDGIDLSWAGRPPLQKPTEPVKPQLQTKENQNPLSLGANIVKDFLGNTLKSVISLPGDVSKFAPSAKNPALNGNPLLAAPEAGAGIVSSIIKDTIFAPITGLAKAVTDNIAKSYAGNPAVVNSPVMGHIADFISQNAGKLQDIAKTNPEALNNLDSAVTILLAAHGAPETQDAFESTAGKILDKTGSKVSDIFNGASLEKIQATPVEDIVKLNDKQRGQWLDAQKKIVDAKTSSTLEKINAQKEIDKANIEVAHANDTQDVIDEAKKSADAATKKAADLTTKLGTASNENVVAQRPEFVKLLKTQGQNYMDIQEKELAAAGGKENPLTGNLGDKIDATASDPAKASRIKQQLGITTDANGVNSGGPKTIGEGVDQVKALRQGISKSAVRGARTYSAADMETQDAIHALGSHLQDNGVNLSESSAMWAKWAPVRDQLVSEGQIFNQAGTKSETLASTMAKVAQGKDPGSVTFIKTLEDKMGPINDENKAIIAQMDANQKEALANSDYFAKLQKELDATKAEQTSALEDQAKQEKASIKKGGKAAKDALEKQKVAADIKAASLKNTGLKKALKLIGAGLAAGAGAEAAYQGGKYILGK